MSDVPSDIYREILLRLPAASLFRFRTVCKAWRRIIDDPSFIKSHTINQQSNSSTLLIKGTKSRRLYSVSIDSLNYVDGSQTIDVIPVKRLTHPGLPRSPGYLSCNGLIFICHRDIDKIWVIWNPLTREFHELPEPDIDLPYLFGGHGCDYGRLWNFGFGYDYVSDDYKVVRMSKVPRQRETLYKTLVYSLKLGSWRSAKDCCYSVLPFYGGVYLNGALHWTTDDGIIALNLGTEDYSQLPWPPIACSPLCEQLVVLGGCLALSCYDEKTRCFIGWMMKEDGEEKLWMKLFSIEELDILLHIQSLRPVVYLKRERQVVLQYAKGFFWVDVENNSVKNVTIDGLSYISFSQFCPGSLFRLDDGGSVNGSDSDKRTAGAKRKRGSKLCIGTAVVKRKKKGANTRLTFCVRSAGFVRLSDCRWYSSCSE